MTLLIYQNDDIIQLLGFQAFPLPKKSSLQFAIAIYQPFFKSKLELGVQLERNFAIIIASSSVVLPQLNAAKLKLWVPEVRILAQKEKFKQIKVLLCHSSLTFFEFNSSLLLEYGRALLSSRSVGILYTEANWALCSLNKFCTYFLHIKFKVCITINQIVHRVYHINSYIQNTPTIKANYHFCGDWTRLQWTQNYKLYWLKKRWPFIICKLRIMGL